MSFFCLFSRNTFLCSLSMQTFCSLVFSLFTAALSLLLLLLLLLQLLLRLASGEEICGWRRGVAKSCHPENNDKKGLTLWKHKRYFLNLVLGDSGGNCSILAGSGSDAKILGDEEGEASRERAPACGGSESCCCCIRCCCCCCCCCCCSLSSCAVVFLWKSNISSWRWITTLSIWVMESSFLSTWPT